MRGYFGIGAEDISKPMNVGALMRTAHAFGASFFFTVNAHPKVREAYNADTSRSFKHVPYYPWNSVDEMRLPKGCALVGVELTDDAVELPRFQHPQAAAYVLGRERGSISPELLSRCQHVVKIPTKFCVNVGLAGALVMYDRLLAHGGYPARPIMPGGRPPEMSERLKPKK
ncbi:RNA methyltransferase [Terricaulis sp.]|uniref:RNA methyltransferase n=1 Tax=Terricaulis sp. TaxID=2768686 RepID=UPI002AC59F03|nr:RNA methyltransferase [Terricaulis sp.]MDZ4693372.1 RNA methyltransferase [Terricaulis sp.]